MAVNCAGCGAKNPDYSRFCGMCGAELSMVRVSADVAVIERARSVTSFQRFCVSCGRAIPFDANVCPYCGHDYSSAHLMSYKAESLGLGVRILLYILSLFIPIAGVVVGILFVLKPDPDYKHVGKICLILGAFAIIIPIVLLIVMYVAILNW